MGEGRGRWLLGMELARARSQAAGDPGERSRALARAGDAYERARRTSDGSEAHRPGPGEALWRGLGRALARLLGAAPGLRRALEDRLLAPLA